VKRFTDLSEQEVLVLAVTSEDEDGRIYRRRQVAIAEVAVAVELAVISRIRHRDMDSPLLEAAFQVMVGGALVFLAGILIGNS
jgi:hypothetical protein